MFTIPKRHVGFTLAEVLITLTVIGVVASMTIPALMNNINKNDLASANVELRSLLMRAHLQIKAKNGGTVTGLNFAKELADVLSLTRDCVNHPVTNGCWYPAYTGKMLQQDDTYEYQNWATSQGLLLSNGMMLRVSSSTYDCGARTVTSSDPNACYPTVDYNSGYCGSFLADVNGARGPNIWGQDIREVFVFADRISIRGDRISVGTWHRNDTRDASDYDPGGACNTNDYGSTDKFY